MTRRHACGSVREQKRVDPEQALVDPLRCGSCRFGDRLEVDWDGHCPDRSHAQELGVIPGLLDPADKRSFQFADLFQVAIEIRGTIGGIVHVFE